MPPIIAAALVVIFITILIAAGYAVTHPAQPPLDELRPRTTISHPPTVDFTDLQLPTLPTGGADD